MLRSYPEDRIEGFGVIKHLAASGDYVVDIGASIGNYTKYLSQLVGVHGRVYSIEPIPFSFSALCSNVKKLKLTNVEVMNYAMSDANGVVTMAVPLYESGGENFYQSKIVNGNDDSSLRRFKIGSRTLDSLLSELSHKISFIKCDVEGHELRCIQGAVKIIEDSKPAWFLEVWGYPGDTNSDAYDLFKILHEEGYEAWWFDGRKLHKGAKFKSWYLTNQTENYFFLTVGHRERLQEAGFS